MGTMAQMDNINDSAIEEDDGFGFIGKRNTEYDQDDNTDDYNNESNFAEANNDKAKKSKELDDDDDDIPPPAPPAKPPTQANDCGINDIMIKILRTDPKELFLSLDKDGDGKVTIGEVVMGLMSYCE